MLYGSSDEKKKTTTKASRNPIVFNRNRNKKSMNLNKSSISKGLLGYKSKVLDTGIFLNPCGSVRDSSISMMDGCKDINISVSKIQKAAKATSKTSLKCYINKTYKSSTSASNGIVHNPRPKSKKCGSKLSLNHYLRSKSILLHVESS